MNIGQTYYIRILKLHRWYNECKFTEVSFTTQGLISGGGVGECNGDDFDTEPPIFLNCPINTITLEMILMNVRLCHWTYPYCR
ncbi:MAG: hypothetical protein R2771_14165 [Saprospiraceae bacterium]